MPNSQPKPIGIDEHSFKRNKGKGYREFATVVVDYNSKRIKEVVHGKTAAGLQYDLSYIKGREHVKNVVLDMCDPFKKFAKEHFPNARITADKFHVLRLLNPAINKTRKDITGDVSFMDYDSGYFDEKGTRVEPVDDSFGFQKV